MYSPPTHPQNTESFLRSPRATTTRRTTRRTISQPDEYMRDLASPPNLIIKTRIGPTSRDDRVNFGSIEAIKPRYDSASPSLLKRSLPKLHTGRIQPPRDGSLSVKPLSARSQRRPSGSATASPAYSSLKRTTSGFRRFADRPGTSSPDFGPCGRNALIQFYSSSPRANTGAESSASPRRVSQLQV